MTNWGLPDWTKLREYPTPSGPGKMKVWAWEFLRRNPEYREFWKNKIEPFIGDSGYIYRDSDGIYWPHLNELRTRFGVEVPSPPQSTTPSYFVADQTRWIQNDGREQQEIIWSNKHEVAYFIDLSRPLDQQFKAARKSAEREQNFRKLNPKNARRQEYILYLRILDATEIGARPDDICNLLLPRLAEEDYSTRNKALNDHRKAARKLRDVGYLSMLEFA